MVDDGLVDDHIGVFRVGVGVEYLDNHKIKNLPFDHDLSQSTQVDLDAVHR
jgi:hypothetical protein